MRGGIGCKFLRADSAAAVEVCSNACGPNWRPSRGQARPVALVRRGIAEKIGFVAKPQVVRGFAMQRLQTGAPFRAGGVEAQRCLTFRARFYALPGGAQDTG